MTEDPNSIIEFIEELTAGYFSNYPYITGLLAVLIILIICLLVYNMFYSLEHFIRGGR